MLNHPNLARLKEIPMLLLAAKQNDPERGFLLAEILALFFLVTTLLGVISHEQYFLNKMVQTITKQIAEQNMLSISRAIISVELLERERMDPAPDHSLSFALPNHESMLEAICSSLNSTAAEQVKYRYFQCIVRYQQYEPRPGTTTPHTSFEGEEEISLLVWIPRY